MILKLEYPKKRTEVKVYAHAAAEVRKAKVMKALEVGYL